ncbi:MAG TPA: amylo-alpha-1,6-glucosidase [Limnochordales bacterium]
MGLWERLQIRWRPVRPPDPSFTPEWLLTNGLGGFACGTVAGLASRRYHGWLVAALAPPVDRRLLWAGTEEWLHCTGWRCPLSTHDYGSVLHPDGWRRLSAWQLYPFPAWLFWANGVLLERTIFMVQGQNTTVARWRLLEGPPVELELLPLINCRDYHHTVRANGWDFRQDAAPHGTAIVAYDAAPALVLAGGGEVRYTPGGGWYYDFHYALEAERGLDCVEDHFCPGTFRVRLAGPGDEAFLVGHCPIPAAYEAPGDPVPAPPWRDGPQALAQWAKTAYLRALERRAGLLKGAGEDPDLGRLMLAAGDFVAWRRTTRSATVVAGYPWFTDWGRDAMISLPGLLLCTGRHDLAREVLLTFAAHTADGLVPNRFGDEGEGAEYNAADASLWFVYAVWKYFAASGDAATTGQELLPVAVDILRHYLKGTRYGIRVGGDGLVYAGAEGWQLTWMDAKVGDWVVTPRRGAAVEVNALWYNALRSVETLAWKLGRTDAAEWERLARAVRGSFRERFARPDGGLWDVVAGDGLQAPGPAGAAPLGPADPAHRPNQLLAASLPFPVVDADDGRGIVALVSQRLLTPVGLRTLAPDDPGYRGEYVGDQWQRDAAYHQGTVWPWLLGPYVTALLQCCGRAPETLAAARRLLEPLRRHLSAEGALGQVSEIFDGDPPHRPRGCFAQGWSVAEVLRVLAEELEGLHARPGDHGGARGGGGTGHLLG